MIKKILFLAIFLCTVSTINSQTELPDLVLKNMDGKNINLKEISKDKTIVFSFWATWCGPCVNELDAIADQYEDLQDEIGFELIAVSIDDTRTKSRVKPLVNGKGWEYEILLDVNQEFKRKMNISSVPYIMIVKNGKVVYTHSGYTPGSEDELIEKYSSLK